MTNYFLLRLSFLGFVLLAAVLSGCSSARSQVAQVQAEKEQLISAIREQKKELEELKGRNEKLASQLTEAEIEIARGPSYDERRLAAKSLEKPSPATSGPSATEQQLVAKALEKKSTVVADATPSAKPADKAVAGSPSKMLSVPVPSEVDSKLPWKPSRTDPATGLQQWASQREWLRFDQASQSVVVSTPLKFKPDGRTLSDDAKAKLDELAKLLKSGEGKSLRVMVADESARTAGNSGGVQLSGTPAHAIAEHLDRSGIASERLGMAAVPSEGNSDGTPRLSLYILPGETPVVGWTPPTDKVRR
jgi:outer membrane protein OmpA-like peptidoglycan-associated protein